MMWKQRELRWPNRIGSAAEPALCSWGLKSSPKPINVCRSLQAAVAAVRSIELCLGIGLPAAKTRSIPGRAPCTTNDFVTPVSTASWPLMQPLARSSSWPLAAAGQSRNPLPAPRTALHKARPRQPAAPRTRATRQPPPLAAAPPRRLPRRRPQAALPLQLVAAAWRQASLRVRPQPAQGPRVQPPPAAKSLALLAPPAAQRAAQRAAT